MLMKLCYICILTSLFYLVKLLIHTSGVMHHDLLFVLYLYHRNGNALNDFQLNLSDQIHLVSLSYLDNIPSGVSNVDTTRQGKVGFNNGYVDYNYILGSGLLILVF